MDGQNKQSRVSPDKLTNLPQEPNHNTELANGPETIAFDPKSQAQSAR